MSWARRWRKTRPAGAAVRADPPPPREPPLEKAPAPLTGRVSPRQRRVALGVADYTRLLQTLADRPLLDIDTLDRAQERAVAVRLDLAGGLTRAALRLVEIERDCGVRSVRAFSVFAAGDMAVASEGRVALDPRLGDLVARLADGARACAVLAEPVEAFDLALSPPWALYESVRQTLERWMGPIAGHALPLGDGSPAGLNRLLLLDAAASSLERLHAHGVLAAELAFPSAVPAFLARRLDPPIVATTNEDAAVGILPSRGWLVTADARGWRRRGAGGVDLDGLSTDELLAFIEEEREPLAFVIDTRWLGDDAEPARSVSAVRTLPYPYDTFLALSSDVDWSTPTQVSAAQERLTGELGLPFAGSFYLMSAARRVAAAADVTGARVSREGGWSIPRAFHLGHLDTLHAWMDEIATVELVEDGHDWTVPADAAARGRGVLVCSAGSLDGAALCGRTPGCASWSVAPDPLPAAADDRDACATLFVLPQDARVGADTRLRVERGAAPVKVESITLLSLTTSAVRRAIAQLVEQRVAPLVWTAHGGGGGVRLYGNLHTPQLAERHPDEARHDMDQRRSPLRLMPELVQFGVRFVAPIGAGSTRTLTAIDDLVEPYQTRDGHTLYAFRRFLSRRASALGFPARWAYGKNAANVAALGFQLTDVAQRMCWAEPGSGAILYTHLGHHPGNQLTDRRGWSEETEHALERLAERGRGAGDGTPRPWTASTASVLLYAAVARAARRHVEVDGHVVRISSWRDPVLGVVPDLEGFGTKLLHGLTVYVDGSERPLITADDVPIESWTWNPADATGRRSVTIVDDSAPRVLLVAGGSARRVARGATITETGDRIVITADGAGGVDVRWTLYPHASEAATHWALRWSAPLGVELAVSLITQGEASRVVLQSSADEDGLRSLVMPHTGAAVSAVSVTSSDLPAGARIELESVRLLRPNPALVPAAASRTLAGLVRGSAELALDEAFVVAEIEGETRRARVGRDGGYVIDDLPPNRLVTCRLELGGLKLISDRGPVAWTAADRWDFDFSIRPQHLSAI